MSIGSPFFCLIFRELQMTEKLINLICINRIDETHDAATFEFKTLNNDLFDYKAGQFLTFEVEIEGTKEYRAYSLSSSPQKPEIAAVTIKRVAGGKVSNFFLDNIKMGSTLNAMKPAGNFTVEDNKTTNEIVLMSAGSGVTPCVSIAQNLLATQPDINITFIYNAQSENDLILEHILTDLDARFDNFKITYVLEALTEKTANKRQGLMNAFFFEILIPDNRGRTIFICGPSPYMDVVEHLAESMGFDMSQFHKESFTPIVEQALAPEVEYQLSVPLHHKKLTVSSNKTLLDSIEAAGLPIVSACRTGFCGACKCKVQGEVESTSQETLTAQQLEDGYVLTCSSKPKSDVIVELEPRA